MSPCPGPALSPLLAGLPGVRHAFFTRQGGVSTGHLRQPERRPGLATTTPPPWRENRRRAPPISARPDGRHRYQVHSATALVADGPWPAEPAPGRRAWSARRRAWSAARWPPTARRCCWPTRRPAWSPPPTPAGRARWPASSRPPSRGWSSLGADRNRLRAAVGPCIGPASTRWAGFLASEAADPANDRFFGAMRTSACSTCPASSSAPDCGRSDPGPVVAMHAQR